MGIRFSQSKSLGWKVAQRLRNAYVKCYSFWVRPHFKALKSYLQPDTEITNPQFISIGRNVQIRPGVWLYAITGDLTESNLFRPSLEIEDHCSIGRFCHITCSNRIVLGEAVLLAESILIADNSHGYEDTTIPVIAQAHVSSGPILVGCGTWIGNGARILGKVKIGRNCVIGTNCVLTNMDIPDYSIVVGIPARIVRRFDPIAQLWRRTDPQGSFSEETSARAKSDK